MTVLTLLRTELKRLTATRLGVLSFIALMAVPLLYGGLYLWGNLDPYRNLQHVPAGLVVLDTGTTEDGRTVHRGEDAARALERDGGFDWHRLTAPQAAVALRTGDVDFVVTFPAGFSKDLASVASASPTRARIALTTSDANGALSSTIAGQVATRIRDDVAAEVGTVAAKGFLVGLADVRSSLSDAADGAADLSNGASTAAAGASSLADGTSSLAAGTSTLASGARSAADGADRLRSGTASIGAGAASLAAGAGRTADGADRVADGLSTLASRTAALPGATARLAAGASEVASGDRALASALGSAAASDATAQALAARLAADGLTAAQIRSALAVLQPGQQSLRNAAAQASRLASGAEAVSSGAAALHDSAATLPAAVSTAASGARSVSSGAESVAHGATALATGARTASSGAAELASGASSLASGAASAASGAKSVANGATGLVGGTHRLAAGAESLRSGLADGVAEIPATTPGQRSAEAAAIGDPAAVRTTKATSAGTYGAGLAPLFLSLSAWIGAYALFLILRPLSRRAITAVRAPVRIALAGWLTPALLGAAQMVALFLIAVGPLGIAVVHPLGTVGVLLLTAATFAAILLVLNAALGSVGQFLGLVLMLVQLVTAGGTFPWQTLPAPLAAIHHALPMAYAVDALRQVMYGGDLGLAWGDAAVLAGWLVIAVGLTSLVAARMTRARTLRDLQPSLLGA